MNDHREQPSNKLHRDIPQKTMVKTEATTSTCINIDPRIRSAYKVEVSRRTLSSPKQYSLLPAKKCTYQHTNEKYVPAFSHSIGDERRNSKHSPGYN